MVTSTLPSQTLTLRKRQRAALVALAERYRRRNEREILELAAVASDISLDDLTTLGLEPDANPQLIEAFQLQYPNVELASLSERSSEALEGFVSGVKGKYFEVLVRDKLNNGETLGELQLEPGQSSAPGRVSHPAAGWDLEIIDRQGETVEQIQLKATESMSYVRDALEKYPDFRVAVPEELDSTSHGDSRYGDIRFRRVRRGDRGTHYGAFRERRSNQCPPNYRRVRRGRHHHSGLCTRLSE